ncbi:hypothetical protein M6B38_135540 [Iris pallida]|uniref:Uncharacterized protein n=1 Tax=Iris pallida TaxID=29817 RepID=A0AAX6FFT9_IRIPA|nr:hypothetical protein M6B38_135540 [Iris pallida]
MGDGLLEVAPRNSKGQYRDRGAIAVFKAAREPRRLCSRGNSVVGSVVAQSSDDDDWRRAAELGRDRPGEKRER